MPRWLSNAWYAATTPNPPWWASTWTCMAAAVVSVFGIVILDSREGTLSIALATVALAMLPCVGLVLLARIREARRCQFALNRWNAGLCPVCKYPRDVAADDICPECGRDMAEQVAIAAERMGRKTRVSGQRVGLESPVTRR